VRVSFWPEVPGGGGVVGGAVWCIRARMGGARPVRGERSDRPLPEFYAKAVTDTDVDPIAAPENRHHSGNIPVPWLLMRGRVRPTVAIPGFRSVVTLHSVPSPMRTSTARSTVCEKPPASLIDVKAAAHDGDQ